MDFNYHSIYPWNDETKTYLNQMIEYSIVNKEFIIIWQGDDYRLFETMMSSYAIRIVLNQSDAALQLVREQSYCFRWGIDKIKCLKSLPIKDGDQLSIETHIERLYEDCEMIMELVRQTRVIKITIHTLGFFPFANAAELREYMDIAYQNIANIGKTQVEYWTAIEGNHKILEPE
jgi:hypothetical protein